MPVIVAGITSQIVPNLGNMAKLNQSDAFVLVED